MRAIVNSATLMLFAPGAFITTSAARASRVHVDVVDAGAGAGDGAEPWRGRNQVGGDLRGAAYDDRVGIRQVRRQRRRRAAAARIDFPSLRAQDGQRRLRKIVRHDNFHHGV